MSVISLDIDQKTQVELDNIALKNNMSVSDVLKQALDKYLKMAHFSDISKDIKFYANKAGYFTDEDIFHDVS